MYTKPGTYQGFQRQRDHDLEDAIPELVGALATGGKAVQIVEQDVVAVASAGL